jgi:acetyl-CoA/propionyl-CoA carboxylase biotin carboxyl carrier protein
MVDPWDVPRGWRLGPAQPLAFTFADAAGESLLVTITGTPESATLRVGISEPIPVALQPLPDGAMVSVEGTTRRVWVAVEEATAWICVDGDCWTLRELVVARRAIAGGAADQDIRSPMPGTVIQIRAVHGEQVHVGQPLLVLEAMKMEHVLVATYEGMVEFLVAEGDLVAADEVLARIEVL